MICGGSDDQSDGEVGCTAPEVYMRGMVLGTLHLLRFKQSKLKDCESINEFYEGLEFRDKFCPADRLNRD